MGAELGLFWLLLPMAAASGWLLARQTERSQKITAQARLSATYFQELDSALRTQPDTALDTLTRLLDTGAGAVETHFALATLFRHRGEVDRAIRIHRHLMSQDSLSNEQRQLAALELGTDYMRSGLLDRAEHLFKRLAATEFNPQRALNQLIEIYEQEQDWENALGCCEQLHSRCGTDNSTRIAHYLCELAEQRSVAGDDKNAEALLQRASKVDAKCVRVSFSAGQMALHAGDYDRALSAYLRVEMQDAEFVVAALPMLLQCYRALGRLDEFKHYLTTLSRRHGSAAPGLMLAELLAEDEGDENAMAFLSEHLNKHASICGLDQLIGYLQKQSTPDQAPALERLRNVTRALIRVRAAYKCGSCGIETKSLYWQCPGCKHWASIKPRHVVESEQ